MRNSIRYDAIVALGGGRIDEDQLTELSCQRLMKAIELYNDGVSRRILVLGGHYSTYRPESIRFRVTGANLRAKFLIRQGVPTSAIIQVGAGRDTIDEAFAVRATATLYDLGALCVVTSDKHKRRATYIFHRVLGRAHRIRFVGVPCGDFLSKAEEAAYLQAVKAHLDLLPSPLPKPRSWTVWYRDNLVLYEKYREIHSRYMTSRVETNQAYMGVKER